MPYINEHSARIRDPRQFDKFRRKNNWRSDGVSVIWGIKTGPPTIVKMQSLRFTVKYFTVKQAKDWLKERNIKYIKFESAIKKPKNSKYILVVRRRQKSK